MNQKIQKSWNSSLSPSSVHVHEDHRAKVGPTFVARPDFRAVIFVDVDRVSQACGSSMPRFDFVADRQTLLQTFDRMSSSQVVDYWVKKNSFSVDGGAGPGQRVLKNAALSGGGGSAGGGGGKKLVARLTNGKGLTPGARDGYWFGYLVGGDLCGSWGPQFGWEMMWQRWRKKIPFCWRDVLMLAVGAGVGVAIRGADIWLTAEATATDSIFFF